MKFLNKILIASALLISFASCEKQATELDVIDLIPGEKAILSMGDLQSAVIGVYGTWSARRSVYISSFVSDEIRLGFGGEYRNVGNGLFNWITTSDSQDWRDTETGGVWTNLYAVIDRSNRALESLVNVPATAAQTPLKNQFKGELLALRAMAHLELLRCFSQTAQYSASSLGVVLQTTFVKNAATYRPSRSTQKAVTDQINLDLVEAKSLIPASITDISRITRNAVIGGQVRLAIHIRDWQGVIDRATEIIPLQPITNIANYPAIWTTRSLLNDQSTEVLWKLNVNTSNSGFAIGSLWQDANAAQQAAPSFKLLNTFSLNQITDVRFSTFFRTTPRNIIAKYGANPPAGESFIFDIKMMRTSEIILARAEAYAELSQLLNANTDLSTLRQNRITGYSHVNITSQPILIDEILLERYKELCYEGQRYFDLKRKNLPINRDISDIGGIVSSQNLAVSTTQYILPIPFAEVQANPNILPNNPGY